MTNRMWSVLTAVVKLGGVSVSETSRDEPDGGQKVGEGLTGGTPVSR